MRRKATGACSVPTVGGTGVSSVRRCPSCGCDKPDNLRLHFAESTPDERAVSCKNCGHYILEADIRKRDLALDGAAIVCLGMGYLDALMQEQGLLPLGESA